METPLTRKVKAYYLIVQWLVLTLVGLGSPVTS